MEENKNKKTINDKTTNLKKENAVGNNNNYEQINSKTQSRKETSRNQKNRHKNHAGMKILVSIIVIIIIAIIGIYFYERNEIAKINDLIDSNVALQEKIKGYQDFESKNFILPFLSQKYELEKTYKMIIFDDTKRIIEEDLNKFKQQSIETPDSQRKKIELEKALREKVNTYFKYTDNHQELYSYLKNTENQITELTEEMILSSKKALSSSQDIQTLEKNINFFNLLSSEYNESFDFNEDIYKTAIERLNDMQIVKRYEETINGTKANIDLIEEGLTIYDQINTELYKEILINIMVSLYEKTLERAINDFDYQSHEEFNKKHYENYEDTILFERIRRIWFEKNIDKRIKNKVQPAMKENISKNIAEYNNTMNYDILQIIYSSLLEYKNEFPDSIDFTLELLKVKSLINTNKMLYLEVEVNYQGGSEEIMVQCNVENSKTEKQIKGNSAHFLIECESKKINGDIELQFTQEGNSIFKTQISPPFVRELEVESNGKKLVVKINPKNYSEFVLN